MKKSIFIDFDSTIINTSLSIINLHNKLKPEKIKYVEDHSWDWYPMIKTKEELKELFSLFDHKDFYNDETLVVFDNAIDVINKLCEKYRVIIVSKHQLSRREISREWICKTLPNVEIVFLDSFDKSSVTRNISNDKCFCFIDDRLDALDSVKGLVKHRICFNLYDWNKDYKGLRVLNWKELNEMINKLNNKLNNNGKGIKVEDYER